MDAPRSQKATLTAAQRQRRVTFGCLGALAAVVAIVIVAVAAGSGNDAPANALAGVAVSSTPTTVAVTAPPPTATTALASTVPPTSSPETTTSVAESATTVVETTAATPVATAATVAPVPPTSAAPPVATVPPATAAANPGSNCSNAGAISIASINVLQPILAEATQFDDGLLCGNHKSDGVSNGVDILPGFASVDASAQGGSAMIGQVPAVIFGHRKSHNHPFLNINKLRAGDVVVIHRLDGTELDLQVSTVELHSIADATSLLFAPSTDGAPEVRLVACSHADGTPGGVNYRWIATLVPVPA
ncbi:MAG: hypothetical protein JWM34_5092 [Ilumatobacteraceae bacterium]|nr:hypothetical protein [Ilumatobacteraceae bacterium]